MCYDNNVHHGKVYPTCAVFVAAAVKRIDIPPYRTLLVYYVCINYTCIRVLCVYLCDTHLLGTPFLARVRGRMRANKNNN